MPPRQGALRHLTSVLRKGSAPFIAAEGFNRGGRFLLLLLLARTVGPESYSTWVIAAALGALFASTADAGLNATLTAAMSADRRDAPRYVGATWVLTAGSVSLTGLVAGLAFVWLHTEAALIVIPVAAAGALDAGTYLLLSPLRASGKLAVEVAARSFMGIALLVSGALILLFGDRPGLVALSFPAVSLAMLLVAAVALRLAHRSRLQINAALLRQLLRSTLPVLVSTVMLLVYFRIDAFLLMYLKGSEATGLYGAAYNLAFGAAFLPMILGRAMLPRLAAHPEPRELRAAHSRALRTTATLCVPATVLLFLASPLVLVVYGSAFAPSLPPYLVLVVAQALIFFTHMNYVTLVAARRSDRAAILMGSTLLVNVTLNLLLIPELGPMGAAVAMVGSELFHLGAQLPVLRSLMTVRAGPWTEPEAVRKAA